MELEDSIYFYSHHKSFDYMSNFYKTNFTDDLGNLFCCSEQYLMYAKAKMFDPNNNTLLNKILNETDPKKIKALGRSVKNYDDDIWNECRFDIMIQGLKLKFSQNQIIKASLQSTGNKILYEASPYDKIWGIGFDAKKAIITDKNLYGTNLLGKALMQVRNEL